jgi:hypothetical protein
VICYFAIGISRPGRERIGNNFVASVPGTANQTHPIRGRGFSHLALGVFYAREGMLAEAEREFQVLVNDNPGSQIAASLLRAVQSWR